MIRRVSAPQEIPERSIRCVPRGIGPYPFLTGAAGCDPFKQRKEERAFGDGFFEAVADSGDDVKTGFGRQLERLVYVDANDNVRACQMPGRGDAAGFDQEW